MLCKQPTVCCVLCDQLNEGCVSNPLRLIEGFGLSERVNVCCVTNPLRLNEGFVLCEQVHEG